MPEITSTVVASEPLGPRPLGIRIVGWAQVVAAAMGIAVTALAASPSHWAGSQPSVVLFAIIAFAYFIFTGIAAIALLRGTRNGLPMVLFAQLPQLIALDTSHVRYRLCSGVCAVLGIVDSNITFQGGFGSSYDIQWGIENATRMFSINLIPIILLIYLRAYRSKSRMPRASA